jgi:hypothetical protein
VCQGDRTAERDHHRRCRRNSKAPASIRTANIARPQRSKAEAPAAGAVGVHPSARRRAATAQFFSCRRVTRRPGMTARAGSSSRALIPSENIPLTASSNVSGRECIDPAADWDRDAGGATDKRCPCRVRVCATLLLGDLYVTCTVPFSQNRNQKPPMHRGRRQQLRRNSYPFT